MNATCVAKVYNSIGVNDSVLNETFDGPAFLTWSRGQNEYGAGIGGPLPRSFMQSQWAKKLKVTPVCPNIDATCTSGRGRF